MARPRVVGRRLGRGRRRRRTRQFGLAHRERHQALGFLAARIDLQRVAGFVPDARPIVRYSRSPARGSVARRAAVRAAVTVSRMRNASRLSGCAAMAAARRALVADRLFCCRLARAALRCFDTSTRGLTGGLQDWPPGLRFASADAATTRRGAGGGAAIGGTGGDRTGAGFTGRRAAKTGADR